ncbi:MAG: hypothetical protein H7062_08995 [Candidatus Saccharimonas sp.]|nr:hypothetical protein [Planctomycetaceae bacterium]
MVITTIHCFWLRRTCSENWLIIKASFAQTPVMRAGKTNRNGSLTPDSNA